jgi:hypothetical protein
MYTGVGSAMKKNQVSTPVNMVNDAASLTSLPLIDQMDRHHAIAIPQLQLTIQ